MHKVIRLLVLFICLTAYPQQQEEALEAISSPYEAIDTHARSIAYKGDIASLTRELTANCTTQLEKARAIFVWITENVAYDYKQYNKGKAKRDNPSKCKKGEDYDVKMIKWETKYLDKVIRKKKGICEGYSRLFKKMCDYAGVQNSLVRGYTKQRLEELGKMGALDHVWNVMLIDGKYYFVDVTWASGQCGRNKKNKLVSFQKYFNEFYWLTPAEKLLINHFPKDEEWVRHMPYNNAKEIYKDGPYILDYAIKYIDILEPKPGTIKTKVGDTIHFKIRYTDPLYPPDPTYIYVATNLQKFKTEFVPRSSKEEIGVDGSITTTFETIKLTDKELKALGFTPFRMENDIYEFDYIVTEKNLRYADIIFNYWMLIRFKIEIME